MALMHQMFTPTRQKRTSEQAAGFMAEQQRLKADAAGRRATAAASSAAPKRADRSARSR